MRFTTTHRRSGAAIPATALAAAFLCATGARASYTRLESIKGTGAQYIDSGYRPADTDKIEVTMKIASGTKSQTQTLFCARGNNTSANTYTLFLVSSKFRIDHGNGTSDQIAVSGFAPKEDVQYVLVADGTTREFSIDDEKQADMGGAASFTPGSPLLFFASWTSANIGTASNYGKYTLYGIRIWNQSGTLVHDYVPARDDGAAADSAARNGLYDLVDHAFLPNGSSTAFEAGADLGPLDANLARWTGADAAAPTDWFAPGNWDSGSVPGDGDVAIIGAGSSVVLSNSTPALASALISGTLTFTNWTTRLNATNVTVSPGGVLTCAGPFTDTEMSNRVWVACTDFTLSSGGKIDVSEKGYGSNAKGTTGYGPGKATTATGGAAHGGHGGNAYAGTGTIYGDVAQPVCPGSSGMSKNSVARMAGGGAVRIDASGTATLNGSITAKGAASSSNNNSGAGSGGSILISSNKIVANGGSLSADGGSQGGHGFMRPGGGGRIALHYNAEAQSADDLDSLSVSAAAGGLFKTYGVAYAQNARPDNNHADIGTVYFTDAKPLKFLGSNLTGQVHLGSGASYSCDSITMTSGWVRFAQEGFALAVSGNVTVSGTGARLDVGGGTYQNTAQTARYRSGTIPWSFTVGGDLAISGGGRMELFAAGDEHSMTATGGVLSVAGDITLADASSLYLSCDPQCGNAPLVSADNVSVGADAVVSAEYRGFGANCGPGKGLVTDGTGIKVENINWMIGAGHGGAGNRSRVHQNVLYGDANDDADRPVLAGSGGNQTGGDTSQPVCGGGVVHIVAQNAMTVNGKVSANSFPTNTLSNYGRVGCGAGGTVLLESKTFAMGSGALISADGSGATQATFYSAGVSGGGRIAVWTGAPYVDGETKASAIAVTDAKPAAYLGAFSAEGGYYVDSAGAYRKYSEENGWETTTEKSEATVRGGDGTIRFVTVRDNSPTVISFR